VDEDDILPTQTGNDGKFLTTDGSNSSWDDLPENDFNLTIEDGDEVSVEEVDTMIFPVDTVVDNGGGSVTINVGTSNNRFFNSTSF